MRLIAYEDAKWSRFLALLYWRSLFELRLGMETLLQQLERRLRRRVDALWCRPWIAPIVAERLGRPVNPPTQPGDVLINARWLPEDPPRWEEVRSIWLREGEPVLLPADAAGSAPLTPESLLRGLIPSDLTASSAGPSIAPFSAFSVASGMGSMLQWPWEIVHGLPRALKEAIEARVAIEVSGKSGGLRGSQPADRERVDWNIPRHQVYLAPTARVHATAVLEPDGGPILIDEGAYVGPLAVIEGPCWIGPGSRVNPHARLHGGNAVGPVCKVGGELDACVFQGHSNKQHFGFLGHSLVGEWVNLGAGTTNSDLKNTYGTVRVPLPGALDSKDKAGEVDTETLFFGSILADHVKTGINTSLPTGCVAGVAAMLASAALVPKWIPSFAWLGPDGRTVGDPSRLIEIAARVMARRMKALTPAEKALFQRLPDLAARYESASP